jgi:hypothetical protein
MNAPLSRLALKTPDLDPKIPARVLEPSVSETFYAWEPDEEESTECYWLRLTWIDTGVWPLTFHGATCEGIKRTNGETVRPLAFDWRKVALAFERLCETEEFMAHVRRSAERWDTSST